MSTHDEELNAQFKVKIKDSENNVVSESPDIHIASNKPFFKASVGDSGGHTLGDSDWISLEPRASVTPSFHNLVEGNSVNFSIVTENIPNGTILDYEITGDITDNDFVDNTLTGFVVINNNRANVTKTVKSFANPDLVRSFVLSVRLQNETNNLGTSTRVTVLNQQIVITVSSGFIIEGGSMAFTVLIPPNFGLPIVSWNTIGSVNQFDFTTPFSGQLTSSGGTIPFTAVEDKRTEGNETFAIEVRDPADNRIIGVSQYVTLYDTSVDPDDGPSPGVKPIRFWETNLKKRIPEYFQGDNPMRSYLEVCGRYFDDLVDTIKEHDVYKDYKLIPEHRLGLLAERFAFNPPSEIPAFMMRGIMRDIGIIHKTRGIEESLKWAFRLMGWEVDILKAWLPDPEKYDPRIRELFPDIYLGHDVDFSHLSRSFIPRAGEPYFVGDEDVPYHRNQNFVIRGPLLVGRNDVYHANAQDTDIIDLFTPPNPFIPTTDVNKIDYKNFLFGVANTKSTGTYFDGRSLFSSRDNYENMMILGEKYNPATAIRGPSVVMSTPYIVIEASEQDVMRFTQPYLAPDGTLYSYTERETFAIAEIMINYLLHEFTRPANVKILLIYTVNKQKDNFQFKDDFRQIVFGDAEHEIEDDFIEFDTNLDYNAEEHLPVLCGDEFAVCGAPTYSRVNSLLGFPEITCGQDKYIGKFVLDDSEFDYEIDLPWKEEMYQDDDFNNIIHWVTDPVILRTPSTFDIEYGETEQVNIQKKQHLSGDWINDDNIDQPQSGTFETYDVVAIRLVSSQQPLTTPRITVRWGRQDTFILKETVSSIFPFDGIGI